MKRNRLALAVAAALAVLAAPVQTAGAQERLHNGCTYEIEIIRDGKVIDCTPFQLNLMPEQGRNHVWDVVFNGAAQNTEWFFGVFEGNATPSQEIQASTWVSALGECTTYTPATRPRFVTAAAAAGAVNNTNSRAEMTFTAAKRIYGAVIVSASAKGSGSGVVASAVRFDTHKDLQVGDTLRLTGSFNLVSA